jgi:hypothetical protein
MEYNDGTGWHREPTTRLGNDIYSAAIPATGDYALATLPGQPQPVPGAAADNSGGGIDRWILIPGIALVILIAVIAAIRWSHSIARQIAPTGSDTDALLTFAGLVAATAPTMHLPEDQQTALQTQAAQLREAASAAAPDREHLHHLTDELLNTLHTAQPTLASHTAISLGDKALRTLRR